MPQGGAPQTTGDTYGQRQGCCAVSHSYPVQYNTTGIASAIQVDEIKASANYPVQIEVSCQVTTAFNASTTNVLTVGPDTTATTWLGTAAIDESTAGYYPASNAVTKFRLTADTPIYIKYAQTGAAATAGSAIVFVREFIENATSVLPQP